MVYFCNYCDFIYCKNCYDYYEEKSHPHPLEYISFERAKSRNTKLESWTCEASKYTGCKTKKPLNSSDIYSVFYHDPQDNFDLCVDCARHYKRKNIKEGELDESIYKDYSVLENKEAINTNIHQSPKKHNFLPM